MSEEFNVNEQARASHVTNAPNAMPGENYDPPIRVQYANEPEVVHAARNPSAANLSISPDNQRRNNESAKEYPSLDLSEGEFVILDVKHHPIGLLAPVFATGAVLLGLIALLIFYPSSSTTATGGLLASLPSYDQILFPVLLLMCLVGLGGTAAIWVYTQNHFYMTNESVIQQIQQSLLARREQVISLGSVEDASFRQTGMLQMMFNYGTIRLSTEGEETTYQFSYVANPRAQVAVLNNAIEAFKNGRAVDPREN